MKVFLIKVISKWSHHPIHPSEVPQQCWTNKWCRCNFLSLIPFKPRNNSSSTWISELTYDYVYNLLLYLSTGPRWIIIYILEGERNNWPINSIVDDSIGTSTRNQSERLLETPIVQYEIWTEIWTAWTLASSEAH